MATQYVSQPNLINNSFAYQVKRNSDGTLGVDYFYVGGGTPVPIPRETFSKNTGIDYATLEENARNSFEGADQARANYAQSVGTPIFDSGGSQTTSRTAAAVPRYEPPTVESAAPPPPAPQESPANNGLPEGYPKPFEGKLYNTPEELAQAVHASALLKYNENAKTIEDSYKKGLVTYDEYLKLARDNAEGVKKTRDQNLANIQGYYNKIAPDAVQSQQGVTQNQANADYQKVQGNIGDLFGGKSAADIAGQDLSAYANDLTTTGKIARGIQGVNAARVQSQKGNEEYMNNVNNENFAFLHPAPVAANTGLTDFLQNLATTVYAGQPGSGLGLTGQTASQTVDSFGNPVKKTDEYGNPIK